MEDFRDWRDLHDLQEYGTILAMSMVITGAAKEWYNLNVRRHEADWTLDKVAEEMFRDIFPDNYDSILCETFKDACQGEDSLKTWHKKLIKLSKRVKFVNEHEICRRFWGGSATYLQQKWAEIGLNLEGANTEVETMLENGLRFERARGYRLAEERRMQSNYFYKEERLTPEDPSDAEDVTMEASNKEEYLTSDHSNDEADVTLDAPSKEGNSTEEEDTISEDGSNGADITSESSSEEGDSTLEDGSEDQVDQIQTKCHCFQCGRQGHIM
jgi:hypothetical protein